MIVNDHKPLNLHISRSIWFWEVVYSSFCQLQLQNINKKQFKKPFNLYLVTKQNQVSGNLSKMVYFLKLFWIFSISFRPLLRFFHSFFYFLGRQIQAYLDYNKSIWKSFQQLTLIGSLFFRNFEKFIHFGNHWCQQIYFFAKISFSIFFKIQ